MSSHESYSHVVRDSGRMLHLERAIRPERKYNPPPGVANCGRRVDGWSEKAARVWHDNPDQRCSQCEGPLGPRAVLKP